MDLIQFQKRVKLCHLQQNDQIKRLYIQRNKPGPERQILYVLTQVEHTTFVLQKE